MRKYDYALFDFDGTLFDTFLGIARSYSNALKVCYGREFPDLSEFRKCVGPPLVSSFVDFYGVPPAEVDHVIEVFRARYNTLGVLECEPYPGVREMLRDLRAAGVRVGIASSKPEEMIHKILGNNGLLGAFDCIAGLKGEHDRDSTKTDAILEAMRCLGAADKSRVAMVGDRYYDAEGAENAGVDFVAALYGFAKDGEFAPYPSVFHAKTAADVAAFLLS